MYEQVANSLSGLKIVCHIKAGVHLKAVFRLGIQPSGGFPKLAFFFQPFLKLGIFHLNSHVPMP